MNYEKVIVKQIPEDNDTAINLKNYNKSRFPGCVDNLQVAQTANGGYITGLDPKGVDLLMIKDPDVRKQKAEEREELVKSLEDILGKDLSPKSDYWQEFFIRLNTDNDLVLSRYNALDVITYHAAIANGYIAPTKQAASDPYYRQAKYYCHVDDVEVEEKISNQKMRDKAKAELYNIEDNKDRLLLIGTYLEGGKYKKTMKEPTIYSMLSDYIEDRKNTDNVQNFLKAVKLSPEDIQYKVTIETAIRKKIIKFKDGQYYRGGMNLGRNAVEVLKNLQLPDYTNEFISIHDEVNSRS